MKNNRFYKTSSHGGCGSTVMFWAVNGKGYVTNIDEAHIYTHEEMQKEVDDKYCCGETIPLSVSHVNELSTWRVDCQYIDDDFHYPYSTDINDEYVAFKRQCWDGNDLSFGATLGESFDYSKANVYHSEDVDRFIEAKNIHWVFVPKSITDILARRTFQSSNINRRKMIQGAGIIGIRKPRSRQGSGKTRFNCPTCGKIHWQFNPYDFDGCDDRMCDGYNHNKWDGYDEC